MNDPQEQLLPAYRNYGATITSLTRNCSTLQEFSIGMKENPDVRRAREDARQEFTRIYSQIAKQFGLPNIPIYFPTRKKVHVRGKAFHKQGVPQEIRIYCIEGSAKPYEQWIPTDISCSNQYEAFDTLVHETAHVLEAVRYGKMGHGPQFTAAYDEISDSLRKLGFGSLLRPENCSRGGFAPPRQARAGGCSGMLVIPMAIIARWLIA